MLTKCQQLIHHITVTKCGTLSEFWVKNIPLFCIVKNACIFLKRGVIYNFIKLQQLVKKPVPFVLLPLSDMMSGNITATALD